MSQGIRRSGRRFGTVRSLPSGRFQARWRGPDGHLHKAPETFATAAAAETWLARTRVELAEGTHIDARLAAGTVAAFVAEWRPTIVHLRRSTLVRDLGYVDWYIEPDLGPLTWAELDHMRVAAWVSDLRARGLEPATVRKAAQILGKICTAAVKAGRIRTSPVAGVKLPKVEPAGMRTLTAGEVDRLAGAMDARYRSLVVVGCHTGLRFGELAALTAGDVDILRRRLRVSRNVYDAGTLHLSNVKTKAGRRTVPLNARALEALEPLVGGRHPDDLLWEAPRGGWIRLNSWRTRYWRPAVKRAGLDPAGTPALRIHDMRHTAITLWLRAGMDPKAVAEWAGHSSVSTVLDVYAEYRPDHYAEDLARLDAYLAAQPPAPPAATVTPIR